MASHGRAIMVTGGASGIGRATALLLASEGNAITVVDRDRAGGEETVKLIEQQGRGQAHFVTADVGSEQEVADAVDQAVSVYGGLYGAVNAAGMETRGYDLHDLPGEDWHRNLQVNLTGMFFCLKYQLPAMIAGGAGGSIVAISSIAAIRGMHGSAEYSASKAGVLGLVLSAAVDYARYDIRVNAILPGRIDTPMVSRIRQNVKALPANRNIPLVRSGHPGEIAGTASWLLSDAAAYVTGASITIDGGLTIA